MLKKSYLITFIMFLLFLNMAFASHEYLEVGGEDGTFQQERGFFNEQITTDSILGTAVITEAESFPLVADLNSDGQIEIILVDDSTVKIFRNNTLTPITSYTPTETIENPNLYLYDWDGDGDIEIFFFNRKTTPTNEKLDVLRFDGTNLAKEKDFDLPNSHTDGQIAVACRDIDECAIFTIDSVTVTNPNYLKVTAIDNGGGKTETTLITSTQVQCFPRIPHVAVYDYDGDGVKEYILTAVRKDTTGSYNIGTATTLFVDAVQGTPATLEQYIQGDFVTNSGSGSDTCESKDFDLKITPPLVTDIDGFANTGETFVGQMRGLNDFKIAYYSSTGSTVDVYPATQNGQGQIVSNLIKTNVFNDVGTLENDICLMGYDSNENLINLLCGSPDHSRLVTIGGLPFLIDNEQFNWEVEDGFYNLTEIYNPISAHSRYTNIIHASNMKLSDSNFEFVNTYGVFDTGSLSTFYASEVINDLNLIYQSPKGEASILPIDYEQNGREDLLIFTDTNLFYLDDGFVNQPPNVIEYTINPCLDATWKGNTTVSVNVKVEDVEGDLVQARSQLYFGLGNEQDSGWSINASSGTEFNFGFIASDQVGAGILRLSGRDQTNILNPDTVDLSYSVGSQGVEFGDCSTTVIIDLEAIENNTGLGGVDLETNAIKTGINELDSLTGLGSTLTWLVIMAAVTYGVFSFGGLGIATIVGVLIVNVFMIIIGTILGLIPLGIIITLVILSLAVILAFFWKAWTGSGST